MLLYNIPATANEQFKDITVCVNFFGSLGWSDYFFFHYSFACFFVTVMFKPKSKKAHLIIKLVPAQ